MRVMHAPRATLSGPPSPPAPTPPLAPTRVKTLLRPREQRLLVVVHQQAVLVPFNQPQEEDTVGEAVGRGGPWGCRQAGRQTAFAANICLPLWPPARHSRAAPDTANTPPSPPSLPTRSPDSGPFSAHSSTLMMRGMSLKRSRVGEPSNSRLLWTNRCTIARAALLSTCETGRQGRRPDPRRRARWQVCCCCAGTCDARLAGAPTPLHYSSQPVQAPPGCNPSRSDLQPQPAGLPAHPHLAGLPALRQRKVIHQAVALAVVGAEE